MRKVSSFLRRTQFRVTLSDKMLKLVTGSGGLIAAFVMIVVGGLYMWIQKYFAALIMFVGVFPVVWIIILVDLLRKTTKEKRLHRKTPVNSEPQEPRIWLDEEEGGKDGYDEDDSRDDGQEEYKPTISRTENPVKKRIIRSNGEFDGREIGDLNLSQTDRNFLVSIFPFPQPKPPENDNKTPE